MRNSLTLLIAIFATFSGLSAQTEFHELTPKPTVAYGRDYVSAIFTLSSQLQKIFLDSNNPAYEAAYELNALLRAGGFDTLAIRLAYPTDSSGIILGVKSDYLIGVINAAPDQRFAPENLSDPESYAIDVTPKRVVVAGGGTRGLHYGMQTLKKLLLPGDAVASLRACRVVDMPDFPIRWLYYPHNHLPDANSAKARDVWKQAADYRFNGVLIGDYKFDFITDMPQKFYDSVSSLADYARSQYLDYVLATMNFGYSNGLLYFNPNFAAGMPVRTQKFVVKDDIARPAGEGINLLPNGGFESSAGDNFQNFVFIDGAGTQSFADKQTKHGGAQSIRFENFNGANARVCARAVLKPFTQYHVSSYVKTENVSPRPELKVIGAEGRVLTHYNFNIPATTDGWQRVNYTFNTLEADTVNIYWGIWGADKGKIWWDDLSLEETAFVNMVRRDGTPLVVSHPILNISYVEGQDYYPLIDQYLGKASPWLGDFDAWHAPPELKIKPGSAIHNGDTIIVSYYHTQYIYDGQVMAAVSEPKLYEQIERQHRIVDSLTKPDYYFLGHDEIRMLNWEAGDEAVAGGDASKLLAYNVKKCVEILKKYNPNAKIWAWNDMFDIYHNARDPFYYLVNGSLKGVADSLPKDIGITNWNSQAGVTEKSLKYFADLGFKQISAPYYDQDENNIREWKETTQFLPKESFLGMLYTTWIGKYAHVRHFGEYAWGHAPYVYHTPPVAGGTVNKKFALSAKILGDDWDADWKLTKATLYLATGHGLLQSTNGKLKDGEYVFDFDFQDQPKYIEYYIIAQDNKGWTKRAPAYGTYLIGTKTTSASETDLCGTLEIFPNPVTDRMIIHSANGGELEILDALGNRLFVQSAAQGETIVPVAELPAGVYFARIFDGKSYRFGKFVKR